MFQNGGNDEIYLKQTVEKTEIHNKWILCPDISTLELRIICIDLYSIKDTTCEKNKHFTHETCNKHLDLDQFNFKRL